MLYFVTVAEVMSVRQAATILNVNPSALSMSIHDLEANLGCEVFQRRGRGLSLTGPGTLLLAEAKLILDRVKAAVRIVRLAAAQTSFSARIGLVDSEISGIANKALTRMWQKIPSLCLNFISLPSVLQIQAIKNGQIDVGFVLGPLSDDAIAFKTLWEEPLVALMMRLHPLAMLPEVSLGDLAELPYILPASETDPGLRHSILALCKASGFEPKKIVDAYDCAAILNQTMVGLGVSICPASTEILRHPSLTQIPLRERGATVPVMLAWRKDDTSPLLSSLLGALGIAGPDDSP